MKAIFEFFKQNKKFTTILFSVIAGIVFVSAVLTLVLVLTIGEEKKEKKTETKQRQEELLSGELIAPFVDLTQWVGLDTGYSNNGVADLAKILQDTGIKVFHLGFINPDMSTPVASDGTIRWGWGGYYLLSNKGNDGYQYEGIIKTISDLKAAGGEPIISFGGQLGESPWTVTQNVEKLAQMYREVIGLYDPIRIDLDIEESNQGKTQNIANAKAIKIIQNETGVQLSLTIPIEPYGWTTTQTNLIKAYLDEGVEISMINSMTMYFSSSSLLSGEDFAGASIRAIENAKEQLKNIFLDRGISKTDKQLYSMLGSTVCIGYEATWLPVFTSKMMETVAAYAKEKELGLISFWSINRDAKLETNTGVISKYEFFKAIKNA